MGFLHTVHQKQSQYFLCSLARAETSISRPLKHTHSHSNKIVQLHSTYVMWLTQVPTHKSRGGATLWQLSKPAQGARWTPDAHALSLVWEMSAVQMAEGFLLCRVRLWPVPAVRWAWHLIHKQGAGLWILWSAWRTAGEMPWCTGLHYSYQVQSLFWSNTDVERSK